MVRVGLLIKINLILIPSRGERNCAAPLSVNGAGVGKRHQHSLLKKSKIYIIFIN